MEKAYNRLIRPSCEKVFNDAYCTLRFPKCDVTTAVLQMQPVCKETCNNVYRKCDTEIKMAKRFNKLINGSGFPLYWDLVNCSPLPARNGGESPECYYARHLNSKS